MKVISKKYPNISINFPQGSNDFYNFRNGVCEMPDDVALKIVQNSTTYFLERGSMPENKFKLFNPSTWQREKKLIWDGPIGFANGYGKASMAFMEALNKKLDLRIVNSKMDTIDSKYLSKEVIETSKKQLGELDCFYVQFFPVHLMKGRVAERNIGYSMFECNRIPQEWVDTINNSCERILVPSQHQKEAFINSGVKKHVQVIPLGLDLNIFPETEPRKEDGRWIFGIMGGLSHRKGTDVLIKAFKKAFPKENDVGLVIKSVGMIGADWLNPARQDPRIAINNEFYSPSELVEDFFKQIDVFTFPTRGEGFGFPPIEAMALSRCTICTNYSGCADFMDPDYSLPLKFKEAPAPLDEHMGYPESLRTKDQMWAEPDLDDLVEKMRWTYTHREESRELGRRAAKYIRKEYDINNVADKLIKYLTVKF